MNGNALSPVSLNTFGFIRLILTISNGAGLSNVDIGRSFDLCKHLGDLEGFDTASALEKDIKTRHAAVYLATGGSDEVEMDYSSLLGAGKAKTVDVV